jgi:hypothetical protein
MWTQRDHKRFLDRDNSIPLAPRLATLGEYREVLSTGWPADSSYRGLYLVKMSGRSLTLV